MNYPTPNPNLSPYVYATEAAEQNLCAYMGLFMPTVDEYGKPLTVPFRAAYGALTTGSPDTYQTPTPGQEGPEITAELQETGQEDFGVGMGALNQSSDGTQVIYNLKSRDCSFLITVNALSAAQRKYLVDATKWGLETGALPDPYGNMIQNAVVHGMAARGVFLKGWRSIRFLKPNFRGTRPFGQYYVAEMRLRADIDMVWSVPMQAISSIQTTIQSAAPYPGVSGTTNPALPTVPV